MTFDASVNIGTVISVLSFLIGGLYIASSIRSDLRWIALRVENLEKSQKALENAFSTLAVQEDRLNAFARRIERLEGRLLGPERRE